MGLSGVRETGTGSASVQVVVLFLLIDSLSIVVGQGFLKVFHGTRDGINRYWGEKRGGG